MNFLSQYSEYKENKSMKRDKENIKITLKKITFVLFLLIYLTVLGLSCGL